MKMATESCEKHPQLIKYAFFSVTNMVDFYKVYSMV